VGGRSGNRGECAQPCRLPYNNGKYVLSLKDLSLADHINELIDSGVASLKIEGRMKSASYVYEVTRTYRKLLDEHRGANAVEREHLAAIFSRGGFTDGYFNGKVQGRMTGIRSEADKEATRALDAFDETLPRIPLRAVASFLKDEPSRLSLAFSVTSRWDGTRAEISASVLGDIPAVAENAPLEVKSLGARLAKLGATPFCLSPIDAQISLSPALNLSPGKINELRRAATDALIKRLSVPLDDIIKVNSSVGSDASQIEAADACEVTKHKPRGITAQFMRSDVYRELRAKAPNALLGIDVCYLPLFSIEEADVTDGIGVFVPPVIMEGEWSEVRDRLATVAAWGVKYALVSNISEISLVRECGMTPVADFRLNVTNKNTYALYASMGCSDIILSPELTVPQARDIGGRVITLGRIPLMITERCFIKDNFGCDKCGKAAITDRMGQRFPMLREWKHRNVIMNSQPTYMGDKKNELLSASLSGHHFILSSESGEEAARLIGSYRGGEKLNTPHRRIGRR
jgi:putative protease